MAAILGRGFAPWEESKNGRVIGEIGFSDGKLSGKLFRLESERRFGLSLVPLALGLQEK